MSKMLHSLRRSNLLMNVVNLFRYNLKKEISDTQEDLLAIKHKLRETRQELLYFKILKYYENHSGIPYQNELAYLKELGQIALFPYKQLKKVSPIEVVFDKTNRLPFVIHKNNRLYFPAHWSFDKIEEYYIGLVQEQSILEGGFLEKSPHQYQTETFKVLPTDIVLDIGSAEALFALEVVDKVKKVYIYESEKQWQAPLKATFKPFGTKVVIHNKWVSDIDSSTQIRLSTSLQEENPNSLFLKLDIEGNEIEVIASILDLLKTPIDIRVACCTYHRQSDASILKNLFENLNYKTHFSEGYMIYVHDENQSPPFFRHGIIRASSPIWIN